MSVFKVIMKQGDSGKLDTSVNSSGVSIQMTALVAGPNNIYRKLTDGQTFTDSNYWKRYAQGTASTDTAFLTVLTDDGSPWDDFNLSLNTVTRTATITASGGSTYTTSGNSVDFVGTYGGYATFLQISTDAHAVKVRLNGSSSAIFSLAASTTQVFDVGDASFSSVAIDNSASGAATATVSLLFTYKPTLAT